MVTIFIHSVIRKIINILFPGLCVMILNNVRGHQSPYNSRLFESKTRSPMLCDFLELSECLGQGIHALALSWVLLLGVCSGLMCGLSTTSNGCVSLKAVPRRHSFYLIIVWQGLQI